MYSSRSWSMWSVTGVYTTQHVSIRCVFCGIVGYWRLYWMLLQVYMELLQRQEPHKHFINSCRSSRAPLGHCLVGRWWMLWWCPKHTCIDAKESVVRHLGHSTIDPNTTTSRWHSPTRVRLSSPNSLVFFGRWIDQMCCFQSLDRPNLFERSEILIATSPKTNLYFVRVFDYSWF